MIKGPKWLSLCEWRVLLKGCRAPLKEFGLDIRQVFS